MTWARYIALVETERRTILLQGDTVRMNTDDFRAELRRAYTEGFSEGHKRGSKREDTHALIKFLTEPTEHDDNG